MVAKAPQFLCLSVHSAGMFRLLYRLGMMLVPLWDLVIAAGYLDLWFKARACNSSK